MNRKQFARTLRDAWGITMTRPTANAWRNDTENRRFYRVLEKFGIRYASNYYAFTCVKGEHRGECIIVTLGDDPYGIADASITTDYAIGGNVFASWTRLTFGDAIAVTNIDYLAEQTKHPGRMVAVEEKPRGVEMKGYQVKSYREFTERLADKGIACDRMIVHTDENGYEGRWF